MPRISNCPTLFDECKTIDISKLSSWGYLKQNQIRNGTISWSVNGDNTGRISIAVNTFAERPFIELNYSCNGTPISYKVRLIKVGSNLGKGYYWYFICPRTGKQCRKLHLVSTYFYHRTAFIGCMYDKQTQSKKTRALLSLFDRLTVVESAYEKIYQKNFKETYKGNPTKRYMKLVRIISKSE